MKKLLLIFLLLPVGAMGQLTFEPFVSGGYVSERPFIKNAREARDYEGLTSYEGAPRLVYMSDISNVRGSGLYGGGGFNFGIKDFPVSLQVELVGEHFALSYSTHTIERRRTEYNFDTSCYDGSAGLSYLRFTPSLAYKKIFKSGLHLQLQAGISLMGPDNNRGLGRGWMTTTSYAAVNTGIGLGYRGLALMLQANFGTANMLKKDGSFNLYSQRFTAGFNIYPKQLARSFQ